MARSLNKKVSQEKTNKHPYFAESDFFKSLELIDFAIKNEGRSPVLLQDVKVVLRKGFVKQELFLEPLLVNHSMPVDKEWKLEPGDHINFSFSTFAIFCVPKFSSKSQYRLIAFIQKTYYKIWRSYSIRLQYQHNGTRPASTSYCKSWKATDVQKKIFFANRKDRHRFHAEYDPSINKSRKLKENKEIFSYIIFHKIYVAIFSVLSNQGASSLTMVELFKLSTICTEILWDSIKGDKAKPLEWVFANKTKEDRILSFYIMDPLLRAEVHNRIGEFLLDFEQFLGDGYVLHPNAIVKLSAL